jgi:hypothetical protein
VSTKTYRAGISWARKFIVHRGSVLELPPIPKYQSVGRGELLFSLYLICGYAVYTLGGFSFILLWNFKRDSNGE